MKTVEFLQLLQREGIALTVDGTNLKVSGHGRPLSAELRAELTRHKQTIIEVLADPVFLDLETRSELDLKTVGGRNYAAHPSTEILSAVFLLDDRLHIWLPGAGSDILSTLATLIPSEEWGWPSGAVQWHSGPDLPEPVAAAIRSGRRLCAHNADMFDSLIWRAKGLPKPVQWVDTIHLARAAGLPGALDQLGNRLLGRGKNAEGGKLVKRICRPRQDGQFVVLAEADWVTLIQYNVEDALLLRDLFAEICEYGEPEVIAVNRRINERGICFDGELAAALLKLNDDDLRATTSALASLTGGRVTADDLNRIAYLRGWLEEHGCVLNNLRKQTVEAYLTALHNSGEPVNPAVTAVLEARLRAGRTSARKLEAGLLRVGPDQRLRDQMGYYKSHTGRWAGQGVQLQNLPKPHPAIRDLALLAKLHDLKSFQQALPQGVGVVDAVASLIRPCFIAKSGHLLVVADFASIEARGTAWCAGEAGLLRQFAEGQDVYSDFAARLFGRPVSKADKVERNVGKTAVLGCGYGMGAERFAVKAEQDGLDLAAAGVTAEQVIEGYRDTYPAIAGYWTQNNDREWREGGLWRDVERAARSAIESGIESRVGRCEFFREQNALCVALPGGRILYYRNATLEFEPGLRNSWQKPCIYYDRPKGGREKTYGGKLVENMVQAICRDLLAETLLRCEAARLPVVLHVHDEVVIEVPADKADAALGRLLQTMSAPPDWAEGFPIEVEAFVTPRYFKDPPPGVSPARARNGRLL